MSKRRRLLFLWIVLACVGALVVAGLVFVAIFAYQLFTGPSLIT